MDRLLPHLPGVPLPYGGWDDLRRPGFWGALVTFFVAHVACMWYPLRRPLERALVGCSRRDKVTGKRHLEGADAEQMEKVVIGSVTRITSSIHNVVQIPLAVYCFLDPRLASDHVENTTAESTILVCISTAFFTWELMNSVYNIKRDGASFVWHSLGCGIVFWHGFTRKKNHYYAGTYMMWEVSTVFTHIRWFLHRTGWTKTRWYFWNGICMLGSFFVLRNVGGVWLTYDYFSTSFDRDEAGNFRVPLAQNALYVLASICLNSLNTFWFYKMFSMSMAFLKGKKNDEDKR